MSEPYPEWLDRGVERGKRFTANMLAAIEKDRAARQQTRAWLVTRLRPDLEYQKWPTTNEETAMLGDDTNAR